MASRARGAGLRWTLAALLLLGALGTLGAVPARAADFAVTNGNDSGSGSLRQAILDAEGTAAADTIAISYSGTITLTSSLPMITRPVAIRGPGRTSLTIQGNNTFQLLAIDAPGANVSLADLTLTKGKASGSFGGNLRARDANLTLTDVGLTDATTADGVGGGGADLFGVTATLIRVFVSGNFASGNAMFDSGAGLYITDSSSRPTDVTIVDSMIVGNTATANSGGGLAVVREGDKSVLNVRLERTVVGTAASPNRADRGSGGGIYNKGGALTLTNTTIGGNSASTGGGIFSEGGTVTLTGSTVSGNTAYDGGGIYNTPASALALTNSTVSGNHADRDGGGIHDGGALALSYATVSGNSAVSDGGGLYVYYELGTRQIGRSIVAGNAAPDGADCSIAPDDKPLTSQGYNVVGDGTGCPADGTGDVVHTGPLAALLGPLADNGGTTAPHTYTHALPAGSPAIDRIPYLQCGVTTDQRGVARPQPSTGACDSGAFEAVPAAPSPSPSASASPSAGQQVALSVAVVGVGTVGRTPAGGGSGPYGYAPGTTVTLAPAPAGGQLFVGWAVDGVDRGWAPSLTITMGASHGVQATFAPRADFADVTADRADYAAIVALATRGLILGYNSTAYGPDDGVQRAQMAALIARAMPTGPGTPPDTLTPPACAVAGSWDCEAWPNSFTDRGGLVEALWRDVAALQHYGVASGYAAGDCAARGKAPPCFGPTDPVTHAETIAFITRAMVAKGYWQNQPGAAQPYAGVPAVFAQAVATYHFYTSGAGGVQAPPADWNAGATRGWFARQLWVALDTYWGADGTLPDGRPAGGYAP